MFSIIKKGLYHLFHCPIPCKAKPQIIQSSFLLDNRPFSCGVKIAENTSRLLTIRLL